MNPAAQSDTFVAVDIIPVTTHNTNLLPKPARALRAQTGGTIRIMTAAGVTRNTFIGDGEILPVYTLQVFTTGTTATGIEALI